MFVEMKDELNEIVNNIVEFVNKKRNDLEKYYSKADGLLRKNFVRKIPVDDYQKLLTKVSIVILTANEYEKNILHYFANSDQDNPIDSPILEAKETIVYKNENVRFKAFLFSFKGYEVLHLHAKNTGSYTTGGSADLVRYVAENELVHPKCIISYGICFGHSYQEQNLGDCIIAENIHPYFIGAKLNNGVFSIKTDEFVIRLKDNNKKLYEKIDDYLNDGELKNNNSGYVEGNVYLGDLITGEAVINDIELKKTFEGATRIANPKGGDMEGYGLGKECLFYDVPCMLIKSICDWGVAKNIDKDIEKTTKLNNCKDKIQAYTSFCAYTVLRKILGFSLFENSIYNDFKHYFIKAYAAGNGCFIPYKEVKEKLLSFNKDIPKGEKEITDQFIIYFCDLMIDDGVWERCNNGEDGFEIVQK